MRHLKKISCLILFTVALIMLCQLFSSCKSKTIEKLDQEFEKKKQENAIQPIETESEKKREPFDVWAKFIPSGYMGDGEISGSGHIQFEDACINNPHSTPTCIKITYSPGPKGWGGIYWQNLPDNWGDLPGTNFTDAGYKMLTFWARGENGGEVVEFKAGGINVPGKQYRDSFEVSMGKVVLEKTWKQYTIDLKGQDLSSVIGGFCWVASKNAVSSGQLIFYLDDIYYEF